MLANKRFKGTGGMRSYFGEFRYIRPRAVFGRYYCDVVKGGEINSRNLMGGINTGIKYLSSKSRNNFFRKMDGYSRRVKYSYLLTLTYHNDWPKSGSALKDDIKKIFSAVIGKDGYSIIYDKNFKAVWKMEYQKRGAPHFHCLISTKLHWRELLDIMLKYWGPISKNYRPQGVDLQNVRSEEAVSLYITKHFSKDSQNVVPEDIVKPGRYWGFRGFKNVKFEEPDKFSSGPESDGSDPWSNSCDCRRSLCSGL